MATLAKHHSDLRRSQRYLSQNGYGVVVVVVVVRVVVIVVVIVVVFFSFNKGS